MTDTVRETAEQVAETITARTGEVTNTLKASADQVAGVVSAHGDEVQQLLATRLAAFEQMFGQSGAELGEKIARETSTLGTLITRHLAEFDRTVKTYGSELVERLGARTRDVSESMRSYVDNFDTRVTAKATEIGTNLDQRLTSFEQTLDSRTSTITEALAARMAEISKTLNEGGAKLSAPSTSDRRRNLGDRHARDQACRDHRAARRRNRQSAGRQALKVANTLDSRIGHLEHLLVGRAEAVSQQIETRSRAAAELLECPHGGAVGGHYGQCR